MSVLYSRIAELCIEHKITVTAMCRESGASRASLSDLKVGRKQNLSAETLDKIASYFRVSVDYLLGRTDDPIDYDNDGVALAEIPLSYVEACGGDLRRAQAMMLAVDKDWAKENVGTKKAPAPDERDRRRVSDNEIKFALFGDAEIDDEVLDEVKRFAQFAREQRRQKEQQSSD